MGGAVARLAARKLESMEQKFYILRMDFIFVKDAPLINWLLYYPIEKIIANYTDCLITINQEDYDLAVQQRLKHRN